MDRPARRRFRSLGLAFGLVASGVACSTQPAVTDTAELVNPPQKAEGAPTAPPAAEGTAPVPAPVSAPAEPKS